MRKRASRKSTAADLLDSPPAPAAKTTTPAPAPRSTDSPSSFEFTAFGSGKSSASPKRKTTATAPASGVKFSVVSPSGSKSVTSISDVKELVSSGVESIKRTVDRSHTEIVKEFESSYSRLHKRFKMQMQSCQQVTDEAEKDYKKMSTRITETQEAMKATYAEFMTEAQASASRVCKNSILELSNSFMKAINGLQSRYGTTSA